MPRIHKLDALVVNKIAAGEVIERPASIVKEVLENSIDALATRTEVEVVKGGSELIRVVDDGEGIAREDLPLAAASHATSKIRSDDDLFRVQTLGFRGEALASIAAVSRLRIRSRPPEADSGAVIDAEFGRLGPVQACGCPAGTSIEVRHLFANTPVRRKFLKSTATEFGHVSEQFTRLALAHPRLHAVLMHNGKTVYELPATSQLLDRLRLFYGSALADMLIWIESQTDGARLWGYVGHPSQSKSTRKGQYLFLNGRCIQDRSLQHALNEAYRGLLMTGRHPIAYLFLELAADQVDVNVHPSKAEVRFRDSQQLYRQLLSTLRTSFLSANLESAMTVPRPRRGSEDAAEIDPESRRELQGELAKWAKNQLNTWNPSDGVRVPFAFGTQSAVPGFEESRPAHVPQSQQSPASSTTDERTATDARQRDASGGAATGERRAAHASPDDGARPDEAGAPRRGIAPVDARHVMQVLDSYLVAETEDGLTVIDQHALHERIVYEQLRSRVLSGGVETQMLLVPQPVDVGPGEADLLFEHRELLGRLGFVVEEFGKGTVLLSGYPPMLGRADLPRLVADLVDQLADARQEPTRRDILDSLMHMMSCKAAVKAGQRLSHEEMESLLAKRHLIDDAHHCPHGRPTALVLSRAELDRQFGRMG